MKKIPQKILDKILSGEMRREHGLETDSGSMYSMLRGFKGGEDKGDLEAQYRVYKARGLL